MQDNQLVAKRLWQLNKDVSRVINHTNLSSNTAKLRLKYYLSELKSLEFNYVLTVTSWTDIVYLKRVVKDELGRFNK